MLQNQLMVPKPDVSHPPSSAPMQNQVSPPESTYKRSNQTPSPVQQNQVSLPESVYKLSNLTPSPVQQNQMSPESTYKRSNQTPLLVQQLDNSQVAQYTPIVDFCPPTRPNLSELLPSFTSVGELPVILDNRPLANQVFMVSLYSVLTRF